MNNPDFQKERSRFQLFGKEFTIVVVVVFSSLSFTLGYFVGKSGIDKRPENPSQTAEIMPTTQKQEAVAITQPQNGPATDGKNTPQTEGTAKGPVQAQQKEPIVVVEVKKPGPAKVEQTAKEKTPDQPVSKPAAKEPVKESVKEPAKKPEVKDSSVSEESGKSAGTVYTVQLAAFRSSSEAKSFSKKYAKKGLKTYSTVSIAKNNAKIYKVKSGEFSDRKAAEVMSLKLNKSEKLKTFVTLKSE